MLSAADYLLKPNTISVTIAEEDTGITGQNMNHVNRSGYALYWVPPLIAIIFVGAALYFVRENKSKKTNHRLSLDEGGESSIDSDLVHKQGYSETVTGSTSTHRPTNSMIASSPMLVSKTKKSSVKEGNGAHISPKYNQLEYTDTSFDMFPSRGIDTNVNDFALRKRTPTKALVSTNESYNIFPVQYDENTTSSSNVLYTKGYSETVTGSSSTHTPTNSMIASSPMLVSKTKKSSVKEGNDTYCSPKYNQLEYTDTSFDMFPLRGIDTNVNDFALRKRTPTKALVSTNESYNIFPVQYDENTTSSSSVTGKDKCLHDWHLEDTVEL